MKPVLKTTLAAAAVAFAAQASAQVTFYENDDYAGPSFTTDRRVSDLSRFGFNDRASSAIVRDERWEVCQDAGFGGHCTVLRPGRYASLSAMGLNDRVSSVREIGHDAWVEDGRYAPWPSGVPTPARANYHRRPNERLYEAPVREVRAVMGPPEQRCWVEQQQVVEQPRRNIGGAIAGALLGGVLGHQVGGGTGRDIATIGGTVAGAAVGSRVGTRNPQVSTQPVQRCTETRPAQTDYWDVTYDFRGTVHHVQLSAPPGATVTVNGNGEPRS